VTRRRGGGRSGRLSASDFFSGDGIDDLFDGGRRAESFADAAAQWETLRQATWRLWSEEPHPDPPMGAETHDGLRSPENLPEFRARRPAAAASIADELATWCSVVEADRRWSAEMQAAAWAANGYGPPPPAITRRPDVPLAPVVSIRPDQSPTPNPRRHHP
jgi:hypothetical protein